MHDVGVQNSKLDLRKCIFVREDGNGSYSSLSRYMDSLQGEGERKGGQRLALWVNKEHALPVDRKAHNCAAGHTKAGSP